MKRMSIGLVMAVSLASTGCTLFGPARPAARPPDPDARYQQTDIGGLVGYGGEVAVMADSKRQAECQHLQQLGATNRSLGLRIHLATLQSVSDACGSVEDALATLEQAKPEIKDEPLRSWVQYQQRLLARLDQEANVRKEMERKAKQASAKAQRSQRQAKSKENELKTLQDKLDALKSIEQGQTLESPKGDH